MGDKIDIPTTYDDNDELKKQWRLDLCEGETCAEFECTECAFYSNENFDKFIKQVGL